MELRKIWDRVVDWYGYKESTLYWYKSKREMHRGNIERIKQRIAQAKDAKEFNKWRVRLEDEQRQFDMCDLYIRTNSNDQTEPGWRQN